MTRPVEDDAVGRFTMTGPPAELQPMNTSSEATVYGEFAAVINVTFWSGGFGRTHPAKACNVIFLVRRYRNAFSEAIPSPKGEQSRLIAL